MATRRARAYELFPALAERAAEAASQLSGGEAQMLTIAQALMASPSLIVLDEPSFGLAPVTATGAGSPRHANRLPGLHRSCRRWGPEWQGGRDVARARGGTGRGRATAVVHSVTTAWRTLSLDALRPGITAATTPSSAANTTTAARVR